MKLAVISFTERGSRLNRSVSELLRREGIDVESTALAKYAESSGLPHISCSLHDWTGRMFESRDALLFIGATGIAVRSIAPFVADKRKDPAVVVMDEKGIFAISLLSGHIGGANELAGTLANLTGAIPVITTATDVNGRFAVDVFAKKQKLWISDMKAAKQVSADILDEKKIGLVTDFPILGEIPEELELLKGTEPFDGKTGIVIAWNEDFRPFPCTLHLIPKRVALGIGCRKEKEEAAIEEAVLEALSRNHLSVHSLMGAASIDLKAEEKGILGFCEKYGLDFQTYSAEALLEAEGDFTPSAFVKQVAGVDNVCERSAVLFSGGGKLIQKKTAGNGVTVALAVKDWSVEFE